MGIVSPVGSTLEDAWRNVCEGNSGTVLIEDFDTSAFPTRIAGVVQGFDVDAYLEKKDQRKNDPFIHYAVGATVEAIKQAVAGGLGLAIMSRHAINPLTGADQITELKVQGFPIRRHWYVVKPRGKQLSVVAETFLGQVGARAIGLMFGLETTLHPFMYSRPYLDIEMVPLATRSGMLIGGGTVYSCPKAPLRYFTDKYPIRIALHY